MGERLVLVFTKPAVPGRVKTRLHGVLRPEEAARLHAAFLEDLYARLLAGGHVVAPCWALDEGEPIPDRPPGGSRQRGADLGERLHGAFRDAVGRAEMVAIVGSDHPDLPVERVDRAFEAIERGAELVLGPARDGGYYLIAARTEGVPQRLFRGVSWSTPAVLEETLQRAGKLGLRFELLERGEDVDEADDLRRFEERLSRAAPDLCPRTRAALAAIRRRRGEEGTACAS